MPLSTERLQETEKAIGLLTYAPAAKMANMLLNEIECLRGKIVFSPRQAKRLNDQQSGPWQNPFDHMRGAPSYLPVRVHPYTCGGDGTNAEHADDRLVATVRGWVCPYCSYRQGWAHG